LTIQVFPKKRQKRMSLENATRRSLLKGLSILGQAQVAQLALRV